MLNGDPGNVVRALAVRSYRDVEEHFLNDVAMHGISEIRGGSSGWYVTLCGSIERRGEPIVVIF